MGSNFFDIPFRTRSTDSDFICKDGEIFRLSGASLKGGGENVDNIDDSSGSPQAQPPVPDISFALVRDTLKGWHIHPDVYPSKSVAASEPSMDYWTRMGAQLLALFQSEATCQDLFVAPFLAVAAWKTPSGSLLSPSAPVLMVPNSTVPLVAAQGDISQPELDFKIAGAVCSLYLKMKAPEVLREWVGKISSLEILVSTPLHSYNTFKSFIPQHRVTTDARCICLDLETGMISSRRICTDTLPLAWKAIVEGPLSVGNAETSPDPENFLPDFNLLSGIKFTSFASIPLASVDLLENWTGTSSGIGQGRAGILPEISYKDLVGSSVVKSASSKALIEGTGAEIDLETRPLKLSGAGELKRAVRMHLRGDFSPVSLTISVFASRDMLRWWCVSKRKGVTAVSLPRSSFRFFKIRIQGYLAPGATLQGLTIQT